ncbi:hypothetical protein M9H77_16125 [Catharanthus roseus]|uniref:Uncharacterized protein n=1 Tax=Catharanthus roseus TaxID=4058 RepID=A0ACC0B115_CATRO|nr:hypothetical protein M9H77_16125 [Catharanthus roseus]
MIYLSIEDDNKDLYLFINSPGGWVIPRVAIYDPMQFVHMVMIHQPASSFYEAQTGEFIVEAEELLKMRETLTRVYVQRTDVFMLAIEAQAYGIIDLVAVE